MRQRDTQRKRVYDAEKSAAASLGVDARVQSIANADLQRFVDDVLRTRAVRARWPGKTVRVVLKRGGSAYGYTGRITLPKFARNPWVILHEVAHCLQSGTGAAHGAEFAGTYLFLIRTALGKEAGDRLLISYKAHRVRHSMKGVPEPRKVPTLAAKAERVRVARQRPVSAVEAREAAASIRRAVAQGLLGPSGRKPRLHALETARALERCAQGRVATPVADRPAASSNDGGSTKRSSRSAKSTWSRSSRSPGSRTTRSWPTAASRSTAPPWTSA